MCAAFRKSCIEGEVFLFQQVLQGFPVSWSCDDLVADVLLCAVIVTKLANFCEFPQVDYKVVEHFAFVLYRRLVPSSLRWLAFHGKLRVNA